MKQEQFAARPWPRKRQISDCQITVMPQTQSVLSFNYDLGPDEFNCKRTNTFVPQSLGQVGAGPNPRAKS